MVLIDRAQLENECFNFHSRSHLVRILYVIIWCKCRVLPFLGTWSRDGLVEMFFLVHHTPYTD